MRQGKRTGREHRRVRGVLPALGAVLVGAVLVVIGSLTATSPALAQDPQSSDAPACTDQVQVQLHGVVVSGSSVTVPYTITGCVGTDRLHIHEDLLSSPQAGSNPQHQVNYDFDISAGSPTEQTVSLLDPLPGLCYVQFDYSTARERHGAFIAEPTCPAESTSPPPTSAPPSTSEAPSTSQAPPKSSAASSATSSSGIEPTSVTRSVPPPPAVHPSQLGPIPHTGFTGTFQVQQTHPYLWALFAGALLLLLGLVDLTRRLARHRAGGA